MQEDGILWKILNELIPKYENIDIADCKNLYSYI